MLLLLLLCHSYFSIHNNNNNNNTHNNNKVSFDLSEVSKHGTNIDFLDDEVVVATWLVYAYEYHTAMHEASVLYKFFTELATASDKQRFFSK